MEPVLRRFDARDYLRVLTKRKWFVIMVALGAMVIGGLYSVSSTKTYTAQASVVVRRQGQPIIWVGDESTRGPLRENLALETQARMAASSECAELAAARLRNRATDDAIQTTGQEIAASISATPDEPDLLHIQAQHRDQHYAIEFANEVARAFVTRNKALYARESREVKEYLKDAEVTASQKLDEAQEAAARYQEEIGIALPEREPQTALEQFRQYENALADAQSALAEAQSGRNVVAGRLQQTPAARTERRPVPNPGRAAILKELQDSRIELTRLRSQYTDKWPEVQALQERVTEYEAQLLREPETIPTTAVEPDPRNLELRRDLTEADRKVADARARVGALQSIVGRLRASKQTMPAKMAHLNRLLAQVELAKLSYQNVQTQLENARLNEAMEQSDAELVDKAVSAAETSPKLGRTLMWSLMLGLAAGIAMALFLEALDDTLHGPEDIATYTEVAFLGMVPLLEDPSAGLVTVTSPKSPPAEAYRTLRSNIHFSQVDHPARTFLVTSAGAGEGKTMTTANLAVVFAQAGQDVLLIDTDLRRPSLHRIFGVSSERGLTNVLVGEANLADVCLDTEVPGLRIVPTGPLPPNPAELLESDQMTRVIAAAGKMADVVFFDSPPAVVLTDAVIMSSKVERTILVAEAGQVTRDAFNEMVRLINNARGVILGVVLNKLRLSAADYYYYYYYYDYSHTPRASGKETVFTPQGSPQGLVPADGPSVLEEIFGTEDHPAAPAPPQIEQPPAITPPAAGSAPEDAKGELASGDEAPPAEAPPSLLQDLFGQNGDTNGNGGNQPR